MSGKRSEKIIHAGICYQRDRGQQVKLGIATVITDEGIRSQVIAKALGNSGFDSIHVTENSHIPASRTTTYAARGEFYWSYDAIAALTAAELATSKLVIGGRAYFFCSNGTRFDRRRPFPASIRYPGVVGCHSDLDWVGTSRRPPIMALKPRCAANCSTRSWLPCKGCGPTTKPTFTAATSISMQPTAGRSPYRSERVAAFTGIYG
jgi:hypothetical protein